MLAIDHIVIATKDAEQDALNFNKQTQFKTTPGGKHKNWGTYNYLSYFNNTSYLEWLSIFDSAIAEQADNPLIQHLIHALSIGKNGPIQFALRTNDMDQLISNFQKDGIIFHGPFEGKRTRPDGSVLQWRMLFPSFDNGEEILPFLIEWGEVLNTPQDPKLLNEQSISAVEISTPNPDELIKKFNSIYPLSSDKGSAGEWLLENGTLKITHGKELDLKFYVE